MIYFQYLFIYYCYAFILVSTEEICRYYQPHITNIMRNGTNSSFLYERMDNAQVTNWFPNPFFNCKKSDGEICGSCCNSICCEDVDSLNTTQPDFQPGEQLWIPIRFLVVLKDNQLNWANKNMFLHQIKVLNAEFERLETPFRFIYNEVRTIRSTFVSNSCDTKACKSTTCDFYNKILPMYINRSTSIITVFVCENISFLGEASLPWSSYEASIQNYIIVAKKSIEDNLLSHRECFNKNKVLIHELGHYMGLLHTFEGRPCSYPNDYVSDTPAVSNQGLSNESCTTILNSCPNKPGIDQKNNYMDYYSMKCKNLFTKGQINRMKRTMRIFRPRLVANTLVKSRGANCDKNAAYVSQCTCGPQSLCNPEYNCQISTHSFCQDNNIDSKCQCPNTVSPISEAKIYISTEYLIVIITTIYFIFIPSILLSFQRTY